MAFNTGRKDQNGDFSQYQNQSSSTDSESLIGESLVVEGEIHSEEPLIVKGKVKGNIQISRQLVVEESGNVNGDLNGREITIRGTVKGKVVSAEKLVISSSGNFTGDIAVEKLVIQEGARFQGQVSMNSPATAPPSKPEPAKISPVKPEADNPGK